MRLTWRSEWPQWLIILGMFLTAALTWSSAPDRIPVHWNLFGQVDRYGGKVEGLLAVPAIALGTYLFLAFAPRFDPGAPNYRTFARVYAIMRTAVIAVIAGVYAVVQLWIHGLEVDVPSATALLVGGMLIVFGNYMGKVRPNWFVGVRTPWTLSSKIAWAKTQRTSGWLLAVAGVLLIAVGFLRSGWVFAVLFVALGAFLVWSLVYSYVLWRNDPDKVPPAGTLPAE